MTFFRHQHYLNKKKIKTLIGLKKKKKKKNQPTDTQIPKNPRVKTSKFIESPNSTSKSNQIQQIYI